MIAYIIVAIIAYFLGSISFSVIFSKKMAGFDVRQKGSGNAGTTNVLRSVGKKAAAITLICDILKVIISFALVYVIGKIFNQDTATTLKSVFIVAAVIGHCYPIYYKFKGGKGVIVGMTTAFILDTRTALICTIVGLIVILITRTVAMGTFFGTLVYVVITIFTVKEYIIPVIISCLIIMFKHRANVKRILTRQEEKLW